MKRFLKGLVASLAMSVAVIGGAIAQDEAPPTGVRQIGEGVYSFTAGWDIHSMFVVGHDRVAVFESFNSEHSAALADAVRSVTDKPITHLFQSHNHWDHSSGAKVFEDLGAQTVMHDLSAQWVAANPGTDTVAPTQVWSGARKDVDMGDFTVEMHYLGLNHGLGMTVFVIPERKAAYIADLVTPNRVMFSVVPDFNIGEWERSLGEVLELDFDVAVCSHNQRPGEEALMGCTKEHVAEERAYLQDLRNAIYAEFQKGTDFFQIPDNIKLPQYSNWVGYDEWLKMNVYRLMTDAFMGPFPWVPNADEAHQH